MRNKVNGLLHYHSVQTTPVGTSALHRFHMHVCVAALHQKSEEKMTETELCADRTPTSVCVCVCAEERREIVSIVLNLSRSIVLDANMEFAWRPMFLCAYCVCAYVCDRMHACKCHPADVCGGTLWAKWPFLCIQVCACFACLCPCVLAPGLHLHLSRLISVTRPKEVLSFRGWYSNHSEREVITVYYAPSNYCGLDFTIDCVRGAAFGFVTHLCASARVCVAASWVALWNAETGCVLCQQLCL